MNSPTRNVSTSARSRPAYRRWFSAAVAGRRWSLLELGLRASTWVYLFNWPNFVLDARTVLAERRQRTPYP